MEQFRLKKEATQFFAEKLATQICSYDTWEKYGVDMNALEKVEDTYITFGHYMSENANSLSGWDIKNGSHFHFTIKFPSVKFMEHDKFQNGRMVRELMNKIQNNINRFYSEFVTENKL